MDFCRRGLIIFFLCFGGVVLQTSLSLASIATDGTNIAPGTTEVKTSADPSPATPALAKDSDLLRAASESISAAQSLIAEGRGPEAQELMLKAETLVKQTPDSPSKARLFINLGLAYRSLPPRQAGNSNASLNAFREAERLASVEADHLTASAALGHMAEIYEDEQRLNEALQLSRRAVFAAQEAEEPRLLYQWHWQTGRLLKGLGDIDGAITAYRLAIAESKSIREMSGGNCKDGAKTQSRPITTMYEEAVDLLLRRADTLKLQPKQREAALREARETIELFKISELRDYFQDDCLAALQAKKTDIDSISAHTAVIYPVILPDRIEMLISIGGRMQSYPVLMPGPELTAEITKFRARLETRTSSEYLPLAKNLYDLLIRPMSADLSAASVDTLVIVPAGIFRIMPFDALHDGNHFLAAQYATAITPGLDLTDPHPINSGAVTALAVGITKSVQGFPSLPYAAGELDDFHHEFGGYELVDEKFQVVAMEKMLREKPVSIIHIASHGNFGHDPATTFLLAYDQKLTMDRLSQYVGMFRFRNEPLELLTLSACQTAAGDDRAALGLAGVAVKSGARSALATLWFINDQASSTLIAAFYRQLQQPQITKAEALRQAKLSLMQDRRYRHPAYWAPFLLINNWL